MSNHEPATGPRSRTRGAWLPLSVHEKVDICRGLFAALVVVAHSKEVAWGMHPDAAAALSSSARTAMTVSFGQGLYYVMGFFVISGYCIHLSVARQIREGRFVLGDYMTARATRILPLYYLGLLVTVAVEWLIADVRPLAWPHGLDLRTLTSQLFIVQNLTETFGSYAPTWSITNEVFYYILYGLLVVALASGRASRPGMAGLALCFVIAAITQGCYLTVARSPVVYSLGMLLGLGMLWFAGVLVAIHGEALVRKPGVKLITRTWPLLMAGAMIWAYRGLPAQGIYLIPGAAFTLMLLGFLDAPEHHPRGAVGPWRTRVISTLGLMSYPMYLFHGPVIMLVGSGMMRLRLTSDWRVSFLVLALAGLAMGVLLGWLLEKPLMARRAAWLKQRKTRPAGYVPGRAPAPALEGVSR